MGLTKKQIARLPFEFRKRIEDCLANSDANLECPVSNGPLEKKKSEGLLTPCNIHFHHMRKRMADIDGLSGKAVIDGIVRSGILADDSPEQVKQVSHSQEKSSQEKTIVTIKYL
jgi:Holliday junction resolvase RusA-like endonuclease